MLKQKLQLASPYSILELSMRRRAVGNTAGLGQASWPGHSQGQSQSCRIKSSRLPPDHSWWSTVEEQESFQPLSHSLQFSYKHSTNCWQNTKGKNKFHEHFSFWCLCSEELNSWAGWALRLASIMVLLGWNLWKFSLCSDAKQSLCSL